MKTKLFLTMTAAIILAGCSKDNHEPIDNWNGEIRLSSGVTVQTRANSTDVPDKQIAGGQHIGVFISDATTSDEVAANLEYTADGNGGLALTATEPAQKTPYYPATGNAVKIIAYHPYSANADLFSTSYEFAVEIDQSTGRNNSQNYYDSDLLYSESKDYNRQPNAQNLGFKHKLSKVVCTLTSGAGSPSLTGATVSIVAAKTKGSFKPQDGAFTTADGNLSDIKMNSSITANSYIAILPPQTFAKGTKFLKVTLQSGGELYHTITDDAGLALGGSNVYTFNITVNLTALSVTSSIEDWAPIGNVSGTAEME